MSLTNLPANRELLTASRRIAGVPFDNTARLQCESRRSAGGTMERPPDTSDSISTYSVLGERPDSDCDMQKPGQTASISKSRHSAPTGCTALRARVTLRAINLLS